MAICTPPPLADFVSDCADIVCASEVMVNYFLSAVSASARTATDSPHVAFSPALVGASGKCGSVDLSVWLPSPVVDSLSASIAPYARGVLAELEAASATSTGSAKSTPNYVWRPIVLAVLCTVLLVFIIANTILLVCVQRKRLAMRAQCCTQDHEPS